MKIQIVSTKCQYQHSIFNFVLFDSNKVFLINSIYIIKITPIITCVIWNIVSIKKFEKKIELDILKFRVEYSKIWIIRKYAPKYAVILIIVLNLLEFLLFMFKASIKVILDVNKIIRLRNDINRLNLNRFRLYFILNSELLKYLNE